MLTRKKIKKGVIAKRNRAEGLGHTFSYAYTREGVAFNKPFSSNAVMIEVAGTKSRIGHASTKKAFIDLIYDFYKENDITKNLLSGGVHYKADVGAIVNHKGDTVLWIADLQEALGLTPRPTYPINTYVGEYQDVVGEFVVEAINKALE